MGDHSSGPQSQSQPPVHRSYKRKLPELIIDSGSDSDSPKVKINLSPQLPPKVTKKAAPPAPLIQRTYKEDLGGTAGSLGETQTSAEVMIMTGKVEKLAEVKRAAAQSGQLDAHKTRDSCRCELF